MRVVSGATTHLPEGLFPRLAHYRHQVFVERLGWQLPTDGQRETDDYDRPDTIYVVAENAAGDISGCARLIPTDKPYMLADVFPHLLNGTQLPRSPEVWELSRFACVDLHHRATTPLAQFPVSDAAELMRAAKDCAAAHGARRLVTVTFLAMKRLMRRMGLKAHRAGPPAMIDGGPVFACWIEI